MRLRRLYDELRLKLYFWRLRRKNRGKNLKDVFSAYWEENHWYNGESKSGAGSTLSYTVPVRRELPPLLERLGARSILDLPCGDFNWFKEMQLGPDLRYIGGDIVDGMIAELSQKYSSDLRTFAVLDAISGNLPVADLWMCRDLVFHLPNSAIFALLDNFLKSGIRYLLITSHGAERANANTFVGGFHYVNLLKAPFHLPEPLERVTDYIEGFPERYLLLYEREALLAWKGKR